MSIGFCLPYLVSSYPNQSVDGMEIIDVCRIDTIHTSCVDRVQFGIEAKEQDVLVALCDGPTVIIVSGLDVHVLSKDTLSGEYTSNSLSLECEESEKKEEANEVCLSHLVSHTSRILSSGDIVCYCIYRGSFEGNTSLFPLTLRIPLEGGVPCMEVAVDHPAFGRVGWIPSHYFPHITAITAAPSSSSSSTGFSSGLDTLLSTTTPSPLKLYRTFAAISGEDGQSRLLSFDSSSCSLIGAVSFGSNICG